MFSEMHILIAFLIVTMTLAFLIALRVQRRRKQAAEPAFEGSDEEYEDFITDVHAMNEEFRRERAPEQEQTWIVTDHGDRCRECGGYIQWDEEGTGWCDCPDEEEEASLVTLGSAGVLSGRVMDGQLPEPDPATETLAIRDLRVSGIYAMMDEIENQWHNLGDGWSPPNNLVHSLDPDSWLRQLLTEELAAV